MNEKDAALNGTSAPVEPGFTDATTRCHSATAKVRRISNKRLQASAQAGIEVYLTQSGPRQGAPDEVAAFATQKAAISFLSNLHGLDKLEVKALAQRGMLELNYSWHGSDRCEICKLQLPPEAATRALSGDAEFALDMKAPRSE